ncbi:GDSL-type esterase/lipase family protein, partial [Eubacteriales bacterium OttesenSCG-928-G02]|nr:GDSL-type esterase/lipase family protein [Eubacteriales bacterium OttesenSCG-928-G02]
GWSNSGFAFNFNGDGFILSFSDVKGAAYVRIIIDNTFSQKYSVPNNGEKIIIENLKDGEHTATVIRITEGENFSVSSIILTGNEPEIGKKPHEKPLKIEFYGDSITCGYGVAAPGTAPGFTLFEEDSSRAYAYNVCEKLNADGSYICVSGKGIVANCNGDRTDINAPVFYNWASKDKEVWDFSKWQADIVIVNLGTNDSWGGISHEEFYEEGTKFLHTLRLAYPTANLLWAYGMMDENKTLTIEKIVSDFNATDKKTHFVHVPSMNGFSDETGGGGHPNTKLSERASNIISEYIKENIL